nr:MAG TPA: Penaeidin [Caudoviricetes sp.]
MRCVAWFWNALTATARCVVGLLRLASFIIVCRGRWGVRGGVLEL